MIFTSSIALNCVHQTTGELLLRNNPIYEKQQFVKVISFPNLSSFNSKLAQSINLTLNKNFFILLQYISVLKLKNTTSLKPEVFSYIHVPEIMVRELRHNYQPR